MVYGCDIFNCNLMPILSVCCVLMLMNIALMLMNIVRNTSEIVVKGINLIFKLILQNIQALE